MDEFLKDWTKIKKRSKRIAVVQIDAVQELLDRLSAKDSPASSSRFSL